MRPRWATFNELDPAVLRATTKFLNGRLEERAKEKQLRRELEAAKTIRRRAFYLTGALIAAIGLAIAAVTFARSASSNAALAQQNLHCRVVRCGAKTIPNDVTGGQSYLRHAHGLSSEALVETALLSLRETTE